MPSEKALLAKQEVVAQLKSKLDGAVAGVLVDYKGITVADDTKLRRELREAGVDYSVVKNTLLRRALADTEYAEISSVLENTTAFAVSHEDPVAAAKILQKFSDDSKGKFVIKAGFVEGKVLDAEGINALAKLPNKEQLLVQLLSVLNGNIRGLAVALNAIVEKENEKESA
ncbi:MAG: 50S ribosomal protein L10 [Oscillospiraceae bacterium]|nr:50S ribosomal protein L10 [Oscillospiraceae bacterium]MBR6607407.1 50S ribosomal protein L10 [Oscillospiraceae bacterium]